MKFVVKLLAGAAIPAGALMLLLSNGSAQANIGFEFETGINLQRSPTGFRPKKGAVLQDGAAVQGLPGSPWQMQLDETINSETGRTENYVIEFVAPPLRGYPNQTPDNRLKTCQALNGLYGEAYKLRQAMRTAADANRQTFAYAITPKKAFDFSSAGQRDIGANPQVTIGLPYDRVFAFFKEATKNNQFADLANVSNNTQLAYYRNIVSALDAVSLSAQGRAFALFATDLVCNGAKQGKALPYAKSYVTNLMRSDMGVLYNLLPQPDKDFISKMTRPGEPGLFRLVKEIGLAAKCSPKAFSAKLFPMGWVQGKRGAQMNITGAEWASSLMNGKDPLKGGDFESMSVLPATQDEVVFELRKMKKFTPTISNDGTIEDWVNRSIDIYDYVSALQQAPIGNLDAAHYAAGHNAAKPGGDATKCALVQPQAPQAPQPAPQPVAKKQPPSKKK